MQHRPLDDYNGSAALPLARLDRLIEDGIASGSARVSRIALVGTFAPRKCGIATFTSDIVEQLARYHPNIDVDVYALDHARSQLDYDRAKLVIAIDDARSYSGAARVINTSGVDAVWIQHEYGIFGEEDGEAVCSFVDQIAAPLIFTFHTILASPSPRQLRIVRHLVSRASGIMIMSQEGRDLLIGTYGAPGDIVHLVPHGAPDRPFGRSAIFKERLGLAGRNILMTFGLLGPGKGLERAIAALPAIIARHPTTIYRIVGATHPNLAAAQGEAYREKLQALSARLGVQDHVAWDDRFLDTDELLDQLEACDIYVTPYANLQQSTSGTLSYAVALGKAVVSTPYVHARELLSGGAGVLVDPGSHQALATAINRLLDDPAALALIQRTAYARGRGTIWPRFARESAVLIDKAVVARCKTEAPYTATPGLCAVFQMSDSTGILQHAVGIVPDRNHGYCLDDNARALMLMNVATGISEVERKRLSLVYASFIEHAWNQDAASFRNFMSFDRSWRESAGSEDSNGRALWALGQTIERCDYADLRWWAQQLFDRASSPLSELSSPRAIAFNTLGACSVVRYAGHHMQARTLITSSAEVLHRLLDSSLRPGWPWFEAVLAYDNPRLSQALIEAGELCAHREWIDEGLQTLEWIAGRQTASDGKFRPVGSESFGAVGLQLPFDQQPLEAQAAIEAAEAALRVTGDLRWLTWARTAYAWFFGANDRKANLVDLARGECRDGVTPRGRNENCGAESILAFQLAHYAFQRVLSLTDVRSAPAALKCCPAHVRAALS